MQIPVSVSISSVVKRLRIRIALSLTY